MKDGNHCVNSRGLRNLYLAFERLLKTTKAKPKTSVAMKFKILGCFTLLCFLDPLLRHAEAVTYQAEDMLSVGGGASKSRSTSIDGGASGANNMVDFGGKGSFIEWPVNVHTKGIYEVGVHHASSSPRPLQLFVEENVGSYNLKATFVIVPTATSPDKAWQTWTTETKQITLCGTGKKKFHLISTGKGPNIDYVTVNYVGSSDICDPPTPSPKTFDGGEWSLSMNDANTKLKDGKAEIVLTYDVSSHRTPQDIVVKLYASDCSTPADAVSFDTNFLQHSDAEKQTLELKIDLDEKKITNSNVWQKTTTNDAAGKIVLCVRVDLREPTLTPPESIAMIRTHLTTNVLLGGSFGFSMGVTKVIDEVDVSNALVEYDVKACVCDGNLHNCAVEPVEPAMPNSMLTLCVWCESPEVEIYEVVKFYLEQVQDLLTYQYKAIDDSKKNAVTDVEFLHENIEGDWCVIRTPFPSRLFDHKIKPPNVQGVGEVLLRFRSDRRKRHLVRARLVVEKENTVYGDFIVQDLELADIRSAAVVVGMFVTTIMGVAALFCIMMNI
jgi:hypothetical protein